MTGNISKQLLDWYDRHARTLPWRIPPGQSKSGVLPNPYHVWLSEIMLQQTQVATVKDYFLNFITRWPRIDDLAAAPDEEIMKAWAGLGYYSRARNLKKCAQTLVTNFNGQFPTDPDDLKLLPGIGDYTSAAIAAIAFHQPHPVVDGNVERVFTRLFRIATPLPQAKAEVKPLVAKTQDHNRPGDFAQACMDLGATICTARNPTCSLCPLATNCQAKTVGDPEIFPVKPAKKNKPTRTGAAFVMVNSAGDIFLTRRPPNGLLGGMTAVPTTAWNSRTNGATGAASAPTQAKWQDRGCIRHTFTHFHLELEVWLAKMDSAMDIVGWWSKPEELPHEALPTVMKKVLEQAIPHSTRK